MKCFIITKKQIMLCFSLVLAITAVTVGSVTGFAGSDRKLPIYCVDTPEKKIAISFDAAWGNEDTGTLIGILKKYDVPATFFVVGAWADKYPESVKQLSDAGFQVQNHSNTHPYMTQISAEQMNGEIEACNQKIEAITGKKPILFRPPYGDYDNGVIEAAEGLHMFPIQWSVDSLDWKETSTADSICRRVIDKVNPGSIVLFHNDADHTPEALPTILQTLKKQGYRFVFISDLIYQKNYEIDYAGKQSSCG